MQQLVTTLLPPGVSAAESFGDIAGDVLFPEEEVLIARAVAKRKREFTTARFCARKALAGLGVPPAPILPGERGAPSWPDGVVGSMTHCDGYRAGAVAWRHDVMAIGLDAELAAPLPEELAAVRRLTAASPGRPWDRLLFSAKEAVFKAWFPLTRRWLGFGDARIDLGAAAGAFSAAVLVDPPLVEHRPLAALTGRWLHRNGLALTAIVVDERP
jgi:4'-phosphopantetheinyl transferase EntD